MGRPDRIYVRKCITEDMSRRHFMKCQNNISCSAKTTSHDLSESHRNNTEMKNIEINDTESILSDLHSYDRDGWKRYFEEALSMETLRSDYPMRRDTLEELLMLIVDICSSGRERVRIGGDIKPASVVREAFKSLTDAHIRYVLDCMEETGSRIRNIRQYLLTALYNSTMTISNYYDAEVRHDIFREGR